MNNNRIGEENILNLHLDTSGGLNGMIRLEFEVKKSEEEKKKSVIFYAVYSDD